MQWLKVYLAILVAFLADRGEEIKTSDLKKLTESVLAKQK